MRLRLSSLLLSSTLVAVALAPVSVVTTLVTADVAWANNGKGNGGGNSNAGGNKDRGPKSEKSASRGNGGGKPAWAGQGGKGNSQKARGGPDPVGNFLKKLTGQDKQEQRAARIAARKAPTEFAPTASKAPGKRPARFSDKHPSELGNMNGALNANIRAVEAKIENGNFNGPVGHMALLAVADANLAEAERILALDSDFRTLEDQLNANGYSTEGGIDAALDAYYADLEAGADAIGDLDEAIVSLGGDPETGLGLGVEAPSDEAVADAEGSLETLQIEQLDAVAKVADYWNKNPDGTPNTFDPELVSLGEVPAEEDILSPEELELIEDMRERLVGYEDEIAAAIEAGEERALSKDGEDLDSESADVDDDDLCETGEVCDEEQALLSE